MGLIYFKRTRIAGFSYYEGAVVWEDLKIGTKLDAVPEENPHDENAVALFYKKHKLGYIPMEVNEEVSKILKAGYDIFEIRIQQRREDVHPEQQIRIIIHLKEK